MDAPPCLDDVSDAMEAETVVLAPDAEAARVIGNATFCNRGLPPVREVVRVCVGGGTTKRSAIDPGGERGNDVRAGRLPGDPERESLCWFLSNVGVNSGPSSCERNREESNDSRSKISNRGVVR